MAYVEINTGIIRPLSEIRSIVNGTSIPQNPSDAIMLKLGYARIQTAPRPEGDVVTLGPVETDEDGVPRQTWIVREYTLEERAEQSATLLPRLEELRKEAEANGIVVNNIRYSGDPSNRAALLEVVQFAREAGQRAFSSWKDSDGEFHADHPLSDVEQALHAIAVRRGKLIALEGQYAAQLLDGKIGDIQELDWTV